MCQPQKSSENVRCLIVISVIHTVNILLRNSVQISSLKQVKRELESKIDELENELDEVTVRSECLEQVCKDIIIFY